MTSYSAELTTDELALLEASQRDHSQFVRVVVTSCSYSCCGRGWHRRDGYEQTYTGYIDNLDTDAPGTFLLYSLGVGTVSYVITARLRDVELVETANWP